MGECEFCGEIDCDLDHDCEQDFGDNSESETGYSGECS